MPVYPTQAELKQEIRYDEVTEKYYWINARRGRKINAPIGSIDKTTGYYRMGYNYQSLFMHRVAYIYHHGSIPDGYYVDHINGDPSDYRIANLRAVTPADNSINRFKEHVSAYGMGVTRNKNRYSSMIKTGGRYSNLGTFDTAEDAALAYKNASIARHGDMLVFRRPSFAGMT